MPATPTFTVEAAFGVPPGTVPTALQWVDLSARVAELHPAYGRRDLLSTFDPGAMQLVLDNADGALDPDNTASAYYPYVRPMVRLRFRAVYDGVTYEEFQGFVDDRGWQQKVGQNRGPEVTVTAIDPMASLRDVPLPGSVWEAEVAADNPVAWWRLDEQAGSVTAADQTGGFPGTYENTPSLGGGALISHANGSSVAFEHAGGDQAFRVAGQPVTGFPFTLEAWIKVPASDTDYRVIASGSAPGRADSLTGTFVDFAVTYTGTAGGVPGPGRLIIAVQNGASLSYCYSTTRVDDDQVHHVVARVFSSTSMQIRVDGAVVTSMVSGGAFSFPAGLLWRLGNIGDPGVGDYGLGGSVDEVVVYDQYLANTRCDAHYDAGMAGPLGAWAGDPSGHRLLRILDLADVPSSEVDVDTGNSTLQPAEGLGSDALSAAQSIALTENGAFYWDHRSSNFQFRQRHAVNTEARHTTSQATFGDGPGEIPYTDIDIDTEKVFNHVTVSRVGGVDAVAEDTASRAAYNQHRLSRTGLLHDSDDESVDAANWLLGHYKDPARRVRSMQLEPTHGGHAAWPQVLTRRIGDRITVVWRPPYGGTRTYEVLIEGIRHDYVARTKKWQTTFSLSPAETRSYWRLGNSGLGTSTRLGY